MNTPAHVACSLLVWRREETWVGTGAVVMGALLPDLPMFGFYAYQKIVGRTEGEIWGQLYFEPRWQLLFDWFNSIPLFLVIALVCWWFGWRWGYLLAASAVLHVLCDLPVHHDDAHRHFLPLTNWKFTSPVSYWDGRHHGGWFRWLELTFAIASCVYLATASFALPIRLAAGATLVVYAAFIAFAVAVWM